VHGLRERNGKKDDEKKKEKKSDAGAALDNSPFSSILSSFWLLLWQIIRLTIYNATMARNETGPRSAHY
jgi:hypothetical protein